MMKTPGTLNQYKGQLNSLKENPKVIVAIAVVFLLLDIAVLLRGQFQVVGRMFVKAGKLKTEIQAAQTDAAFFSTYKNRQADLKKEIEDLNKKIILEEAVPRAIESISKFAELSGVRILRIKPLADAATANAGAKALPASAQRQKISLIAKCGFHQTGRFIGLLESAAIFFDIRSIEVRSDESEYGKQMVTLILEVLVKKP
ncbi:MAG: hypothetical protein V1863_03180 [Candidatus Omnitrophota bacterium]